LKSKPACPAVCGGRFALQNVLNVGQGFSLAYYNNFKVNKLFVSVKYI
jgi:hypothetical protein